MFPAVWMKREVVDDASKHSADTADKKDDGWCVSVCNRSVNSTFIKAIQVRAKVISRSINGIVICI